MYYRFEESIDATIFQSECNLPIAERVVELMETIRASYGDHSSYGGSILLFPTKEEYEKYIDSILSSYSISSRDDYEYSDVILADDTPWMEALYIWATEQSRIILSPETAID